MLEFFDPDNNSGTATLYDRHISLNTKLIKHFNDAYRVRVGFDKDQKEVCIFPVDKDHALSGEIKESSLLSLSVNKSYVRIASKPLIECLCKTFGFDISKGESIQFEASFDENRKCLVIDMGGRK